MTELPLFYMRYSHCLPMAHVPQAPCSSPQCEAGQKSVVTTPRLPALSIRKKQ